MQNLNLKPAKTCDLIYSLRKMETFNLPWLRKINPQVLIQDSCVLSTLFFYLCMMESNFLVCMKGLLWD